MSLREWGSKFLCGSIVASFGSVERQFDICGCRFEMTQSKQLCEFLLPCFSWC